MLSRPIDNGGPAGGEGLTFAEGAFVDDVDDETMLVLVIIGVGIGNKVVVLDVCAAEKTRILPTAVTAATLLPITDTATKCEGNDAVLLISGSDEKIVDELKTLKSSPRLHVAETATSDAIPFDDNGEDVLSTIAMYNFF